MNTYDKLLQRQLIQNKIDYAHEVVKKSKKAKIVAYFNLQERDAFYQVTSVLANALSTIEETVTPRKVIYTYLKSNSSSARRLFTERDEKLGSKTETIESILDRLEEVANEEIGTLEDLKEELKKDDAVKQLVLQ